MMRAKVFRKYGDASVLETEEVPKPTAGAGQIVVQNKAVSVNPIDFKVRKGALDPNNTAPKGESGEPQSKIVGWDAAGVVVEAGAGSGFLVGDKVWYAGDLTKSGTYSEFTLVDGRIVGRMPSNLTFEDAAAMPLTFQTAYEAFVEQMGADKVEDPKSKYALIYNGAGGLGSAGIQIAKMLNLNVVATASREDSVAHVKGMGADLVFNHHTKKGQTLEEVVKKNFGESFKGFDYILNAHENDKLHELIKILNVNGQICLTWKTTAEELGKIDMDDVWLKRKSIVYTLMFSRSLFNEGAEKVGAFFNKLGKAVEEGKVSTTKKTHFPDFFADIQKAHELQESGKAVGKTVLTMK